MSNKIPHTRVELYGERFDSRLESERYLFLRGEEKSGRIESLEIHPKLSFDISGRHICSYTADFSYEYNGVVMYEEVKSKGSLKYEDVKRRYSMNRRMVYGFYDRAVVLVTSATQPVGGQSESH